MLCRKDYFMSTTVVKTIEQYNGAVAINTMAREYK